MDYEIILAYSYVTSPVNLSVEAVERYSTDLDGMISFNDKIAQLVTDRIPFKVSYLILTV